MSEERVTIGVAEGVAHVRLNRPDKMNALDGEMFAALAAAIERLRTMQGVRVVVLSGAGKAFCAGLDRDLFARMASGAPTGLPDDLATRTHGLANLPQQVAWGWRELPIPVIAAVHGAALGGGLQVALGADIRYVAPDAKLSILEVKWGLVPDMAGFALLRSLARGDVIRELAMTGRVFSGAEAVPLGLATAVYPDPLQAAMRSAAEIAARSPHAVRGIKRLANFTEDASAAEVLLAESKEQTAIIGSPNQVEAILAGVQGRAGRFAEAE